MPGAGGVGRSQSVQKFFENSAVASGAFPHSIECGPIEAMLRKQIAINSQATRKRAEPISLPLSKWDVMCDILTIKPPKKEKRQRSGKRQDQSSQLAHV